MQEQKAPAQTRTTIAEKTDIAAGLALFPAMTVMVFLRRKPGYRFLSPVKLFVMFLVLWVIGGVSTVANAQTTTSPASGIASFIIFALAMLITGMVKRYLRWKEIKAGISWHTYSRGVSWFSFLPLADTQIKRFIDPLAVLIVGLLVMIPFRFLGYYLIFSAVCLCIFEAVDYEKSINRMLDVIDNLVESEIMSENAEYYTTGKPTEKPLDQTAGIPTGVSPDLAAAIERKRRNRKPQIADNLVAPQQGRFPNGQNRYPPQEEQFPMPPPPTPTGQRGRQYPPDNLVN